MRASIIGLVESAEAPGVTAVKVEIKRRDSSEPHSGHRAGSSAAFIERIRSKRSSHLAHLYS
jgi:hypothetical protein